LCAAIMSLTSRSRPSLSTCPVAKGRAPNGPASVVMASASPGVGERRQNGPNRNTQARGFGL